MRLSLPPSGKKVLNQLIRAKSRQKFSCYQQQLQLRKKGASQIRSDSYNGVIKLLILLGTHAQISGSSTISASASKNSTQIVRSRKIVLFRSWYGTMTALSQNPILASLTNQTYIWYLKRSTVITSIHLTNQTRRLKHNAAIPCVTHLTCQALQH